MIKESVCSCSAQYCIGCDDFKLNKHIDNLTAHRPVIVDHFQSLEEQNGSPTNCIRPSSVSLWKVQLYDKKEY